MLIEIFNIAFESTHNEHNMVINCLHRGKKKDMMIRNVIHFFFTCLAVSIPSPPVNRIHYLIKL